MLDGNNQEMAAQKEGLDTVEVPSRFSAISSAKLASGPLARPDLRLRGQTPPWKLQRTTPSLELSGPATLHYLWAHGRGYL